MFPDLKLVEGFIYESLLPQEDAPTLQIADVFDLLEEFFHLFFVHTHVVDDLVVLLAQLLQSLTGVVFDLVEQEEIVAECLNDSLDLLLKH